MIELETDEGKRAEALRRRAAGVADADDCATVQDLDGRIVGWSRGAERMLGYPRDEARQLKVEALVPEETRADARGLLEAVALGKEVGPLEVSRLTKDGRTLRVWLTITRLVDDQGRTVGVATTERDITDRNQLVEVLRESAQAERRSTALLRTITSNTPDPVFVKDAHGCWLFANPAALETIGKPAEQVIGRRDREVFDDAGTGAALAETDRRIMEGGGAVAVEERVATPGGCRWFLSTKAPVRDASGRVTGLVGVARDITERKQAEEALRESEERFRALATATSDVVYRMGPDWKEMRALRGREFIADTDAPTRSWLDKYIHPDDQPYVMSAIAEAIRTKSTFQLEHRVLRVDGSLGWTFSRAIPLVDANGDIVEWFGAASDITERKRGEDLRASEAALREADRQKNQFLAMLSHELRNPLAPIRNSLYLLERAAPGGEHAIRAMAVIERQVGHMTRLIDDLLDVTRIVRGKVRLRRETLDLNELVQRTVEDHRTSFLRSDVRVEMLPATTEVRVNGDRTRLAQAVANLLQNAVKFTPRGGKTTISVQADRVGGQAILTVRDTGSGIAPEMLPRLFHAFIQADTTLDRSKGGLGLGLALVKGLVEMHGGSVTAASSGPGRGAAFTIRLPLDVAAARILPARRRGIRGAGAPRRVLVIEDNDDAADTMREVLELDEHVVEVAYSGREGIDKARVFHPDVVLCDIGLPEMDGYEVARTLRADPELGRVTLVAVSGYAQPEDVAAARKAGFDAHLAKPPSIEMLERVLADVEHPRVGRQGAS